jgi:hypothetical protein
MLAEVEMKEEVAKEISVVKGRVRCLDLVDDVPGKVKKTQESKARRVP